MKPILLIEINVKDKKELEEYSLGLKGSSIEKDYHILVISGDAKVKIINRPKFLFSKFKFW